jgi:hypothetical protein
MNTICGLEIAFGFLALAFLVLSVMHFALLSRSFPKFQWTEPYPSAGGYIEKIHGGIKVAEPDQIGNYLGEWEKRFNDYLSSINDLAQKENTYAAIGYLVACLSTVGSLVALLVTNPH